MEDRFCVVEMGLSPRVRGNRGVLEHERQGERSIPACAGEPIANRARLWYTGVYPRVCGGTVLTWIHIVVLFGLSPRVRGNQYHYHRRRGGERSIPACAGEP